MTTEEKLHNTLEEAQRAKIEQMRTALDAARTVLEDIRGEGVGGEDGMYVISVVLRDINRALKR